MMHFSGELRFGHSAFSVTVPAADSIALRGRTAKKGLIYAYLYDAHDRLRANMVFDSRDKQLVVGADRADPGGIKGAIEPGEWRLYLYRLDGEHRSPDALGYQVEVAFDVPPPPSELATLTAFDAANRDVFDYQACYNPATRWYRGDLHAHTALSDGNNAFDAAAGIVAQQQLDFFFLTEHNVCHPTLPRLDNRLIMPGIEVTTDLGHFNVHGPDRLFDLHPRPGTSLAMIETGLALAESGRGNISVNHPMMKPWHWLYREMPLNRVHTLEVCCDPTWSTSPQSSDQALRVLNAMWNAGHRIVAVGGSDSHLQPHERNPNATEPSIYGDPATFVYARGLNGENILTGLRQGKVYVERHCQLDFTINGGATLPGDDVGDSIANYRLAVADAARDYVADCIVDGECIARYPLSREPVHFTVDLRQRGWARIDIRQRHSDEFEGLINPVYNRNAAAFARPTLATWGELMDSMKD